jgi:phosphotransferase system HPr (HPr) family protein
MSDGAPRARRTVVVRHAEGFHARPCSAIAVTAKRYRSAVRIVFGQGQADARSVFELMLLTVAAGDAVEVVAEGRDAEAAVDALVRLIEDDFPA